MYDVVCVVVYMSVPLSLCVWCVVCTQDSELFASPLHSSHSLSLPVVSGGVSRVYSMQLSTCHFGNNEYH